MKTPQHHGILLVDKPPGMTSHDLVRDARRTLGQRKIGHCGTLDPDATGLLILTAGRGTRLTRFLMGAPKVYEGTIHFGTATDTYDAGGEITLTRSTDQLNDAVIDEALQGFVGRIEQLPPPYSAKKVEGRKYYELARQGVEFERKPATVEIHELERTAPLHEDRISFRLACGSGTYARSLAHDLGAALASAAHLETLRRTSIGPFSLASATDGTQLGEPIAEPRVLDGWIPFSSIPLPFPVLDADEGQARRILHGQTVVANHLQAQEGDWIKVVDPAGDFIAVGSVVERIGRSGPSVIQPKIVFN